MKGLSLGLGLTGGPSGPSYGPELVSNGAFDSNTTGWASKNSAVLSSTGGRLRVTVDALGTAGAGAEQIIVSGLEAAKTYRFQATLWAQVSGYAAIYHEGQLPAKLISGTGPTDLDFTFTGLTFLYVQPSVTNGGAWGAANSWAEFDNISIREVL